MLIYLDNLETSSRPVADRDICRKSEFREAECTIAGLVEAINEGDVEVGGIIAAEP